MKITPPSPPAFANALALLKRNNLPVHDISPGTQLFVMEDDDKVVVGTIAVEYDRENALLRSLSVDSQKRNAGLGKLLVDFIEDYVHQQGVQNIYLLTTTAKDFFSKRGYTVIDRIEVPAFIGNTSEYISVCPASATVMKKSMS